MIINPEYCTYSLLGLRFLKIKIELKPKLSGRSSFLKWCKIIDIKPVSITNVNGFTCQEIKSKLFVLHLLSGFNLKHHLGGSFHPSINRGVSFQDRDLRGHDVCCPGLQQVPLRRIQLCNLLINTL